MKKSRFTNSQILAVLKQAEAGTPVPQLCREHGISSAALYKWRSKFGGMDASLMSQLKELQDENRRLKKMYGDAQPTPPRLALRGRPSAVQQVSDKFVESVGSHPTLSARNAKRPFRGALRFWRREWDCRVHPCTQPFRAARSKHAGHLKDKLELNVTQVVDLAGAIAEAHARVVVLRPMCDAAPAIEGQFVALPSSDDPGPIDTQSIRPSNFTGEDLFS